MDENIKLVDFEHYCPKCEYFKTKETDEPCNTCLSIGGRNESRKPEYFKEDNN